MVYDADRRLQKAVERFEEGDLATARSMLKGLDRRGVVSPRIDLYLGHCHLEDDRLEAALARYRRAAALSPESAAPWIGLGLAHGRIGQIERAVAAFERALALEPKSEEAHCNLTHCHALRGDLSRALAHAREAARLDATCPHLHRHLAVAHLLAGRPREALEAWRNVEAREPDYPELSVGRGRAYVALHRLGEARTAFLRGLEGPFRADAALGLGDLARDQGRPVEALEHYRTAVAADAAVLEGHTRLAETLLSLGRAREAWDGLEPLLIPWSHETELLGTTARVLVALGQRSEAVALLRTRTQAEPSDALGWLRLGQHLLEIGRPRRAIAPLRRALRLGGSDPEPARLLARALARAGRRKEAISTLAAAAFRRPEASELHVDVAAALLARGRGAAGERALIRALAWNPEAARVWTAAAEMALEGGRLGLARSRLRSALRRDPRQPQALGLLMRWLLLAGRPRHAVRVGGVALRAAGVGDEVVRTQAEALLEAGRPEEAQLPARRYVLDAPQDPAGYRVLGRIYARLGNRAGAALQERLAATVTGTDGRAR